MIKTPLLLYNKGPVAEALEFASGHLETEPKSVNMDLKSA